MSSMSADIEGKGSDGGSQQTLKDQQRPLSPSWRTDPLTPDEGKKVASIIQACNDADVAALAALASTEGGFIEDEIRRRTWPILLGDDVDENLDWHTLSPHRDEDQIKLDVNRAFVHYPRGESEKRLEGRKEELLDLIISVVRHHPDLNYFQGYHDIAQVFLLVLGAKDAAPALARLSLLRIRDFMLPTMTGTHSHLNLLPTILYASDPELCKHLSGVPPHYGLAATLTLFAHDIEEYGGIARLFDFLLARPAVVSVYLFAATVLSRRDEIFEFAQDDTDMMLVVLSKLPQPLDIQALISQTTSLFAQHPPRTLPSRSWRSISASSVLKTTEDPVASRQQTLKQGEMWLQAQAREIEQAEVRKRTLDQTKFLMRKYRRPASALVFAILFGVIGVWLGRDPSTLQTGTYIRPLYMGWQMITETLAPFLRNRSI